MKLVLRIVLGLAGLAGALIALRFWMAPAEIAKQFALSADTPLGLATMRADLAGFFGVCATMAIAAAVRAEARFLTAPVILIALALSGRAITVLVNGFSADMAMPMSVEAVLLILFGAGRLFLGSRSASGA